MQFEGGPCAVLAPVQAYIVKHIVNNKSADDDWKKVIYINVIQMQIVPTYGEISILYRWMSTNKIVCCVKPPVISFAKRLPAVIY